MHTPEITRSTNHETGFGWTTWMSTAPDASDARPEKTRTCPTRTMVDGAASDPTTKPA